MLSLNKLRLVFLMWGFFILCEPAITTKPEQGCGSRLQLCCEGKPYNPRKDTCCKPQDGNGPGNLTVGLSERMSQCCGEKAYNPLNEMCCNLTVKPKPSHDAKCCDKEPYDESKKICCTPNVLEKLSPYHLCCYGKLFDSSIENCCQNKFPRIEMKMNNSKGCVKNFTCDPTFPGEDQCENLSADSKMNETIESDKKQVCGTGDEKEVYDKKNGFGCCGRYYFNTTLWSCETGKLRVKIKNDGY